MTKDPIKSTTLAQFDAAEQTALAQLALKVQHAFVTGAGGFLGKAICLRLLAAGIKVTGFARGHYPELEALGVVMLQGDLVNKDLLQQAMQRVMRRNQSKMIPSPRSCPATTIMSRIVLRSS